MTGRAGSGRSFVEADYLRVRRLLVDCLPMTAPGFLWEVRRWDGSRFYQAEPSLDPAWELDARSWDDAAGALVAVAHREGRGEAHLQVHPAHRDLEDEMIAWAEERLAIEAGGARRLRTPVREYDRLRQGLLEARGWQRTAVWGATRWLRFGTRPVAPSSVAAGYAVRSLRPGERVEALRMAELLNAAFGRTSHDAPEFLTFELYAPDYDPRLHLVAEAPDGSFAAHVGVTLEPVNRLAIVEPVCTHPDHRRRGLAEALLRHGLELARQAGATQACVDTGAGEAANRLYEAVGFLEVFPAWDWEWRR